VLHRLRQRGSAGRPIEKGAVLWNLAICLRRLSTGRTRAARTAGAASRARKTNDVQLRVVDTDRGYLADHWCSKDHILYVISGSLTIEHSDGKESYELPPGVSWQTADDGSLRRSISGARVFIVD
jgi:hypothetical protein